MVGPASPSIATTQLPGSGVVGATFKDRASVAGLFGGHPGGSVSWRLFANKGCEGEPVAVDGPVSVSGDGDYSTPSGASPVAAGTYYWVAAYSGDANNKEVVSGCADEPVVVTSQPQPQPQPPQPQPVAVVLPFKAISGVASPHGPQGCVESSTSPVYVVGHLIASVTFYLDGHKVKTVTRPDAKGRYGIKVASHIIRVSVHRVRTVVVFSSNSQTKPAILRSLIYHCRPPEPKFTG